MPNGHYANSEYQRNKKRMVYYTWRKQLPCWLCKKPFRSKGDITADHFIPIFRGGTHAYENLKPAHDLCNSQREYDDEIFQEDS